MKKNTSFDRDKVESQLYSLTNLEIFLYASIILSITGLTYFGRSERISMENVSTPSYKSSYDRILAKYGDINSDGKVDSQEKTSFNERLSLHLEKKGYILMEDDGILKVRSKDDGNIQSVKKLEELAEGLNDHI